jgi:hypothetical protein
MLPYSKDFQALAVGVVGGCGVSDKGARPFAPAVSVAGGRVVRDRGPWPFAPAVGVAGGRVVRDKGAHPFVPTSWGASSPILLTWLQSSKALKQGATYSLTITARHGR